MFTLFSKALLRFSFESTHIASQNLCTRKMYSRCCPIYDIYLAFTMEKPGEQCTVAFALIVTKPSSKCYTPPPPSHVCSVTFMQRRQCIVLKIPPWLLPYCVHFSIFVSEKRDSPVLTVQQFLLACDVSYLTYSILFIRSKKNCINFLVYGSSNSYSKDSVDV